MKRLALSALILFAALTVNAQNLRFGVKGGLNFSKETQSDFVKPYISSDLSYRTGFHVGGVVNYSLDERWELEADLLYSMQGYTDKIATTDSEQNLNDENYTATSHYINLPIAVKFYPVNGFYVELGPQFGYLISKKGKFDNFETFDLYTSDNIKHFDFGLFGGIGYRFSNDVFLDARYIYGLIGTSKEVGGSKNRNIQISIGYSF